MDRRTLLLGATALGAFAHIEPGEPAVDDPQAILGRAIAAAGGKNALHNARVLAWRGNGTIHLDDRDIDIGVDTVVEPFVYARSETWLPSQERASRRILEIDETGGWATINGQRSPLPEAQTTHERQQYALYGLLRLVTLLDQGVSFEPAALVITGSRLIRDPGYPVTVAWREFGVTHPHAPRTWLAFHNAYRVFRAANYVSNPEAGEPDIYQVFRFNGVIEGGGVRWFRHMRICQNNKPYFDLTLDSFTPRERR